MKIISIGDIHSRTCWEQIVEKEKDSDIIIMVGDYFDTFEPISAAQQISNFRNIIEFKKSRKDVILLIGNHDIHYWAGWTETYSGYQAGARGNIEQVLGENVAFLQMAYKHENLLFTHAGVTDTWLKHNGQAEGFDECQWTNDLWKWKPCSFEFNGFDPYGDNITQSPVWVRPRSLMHDSKALKKQGVIQIVGHTGQKGIDIKGKATGGKYFFIDTLAKSVREYLIYEDRRFSIGKF